MKTLLNNSRNIFLNSDVRPTPPQGRAIYGRTNSLVHTKQTGFSMVELMISVVIGLFITLGLSKVFLNMYSTSQSQNTLANYQENQRLPLVMLVNSIQLAGHFSDTPTSTTQSVTSLPHLTTDGTAAGSDFLNPDNSKFVDGAGIVGTSGTGTNSDTINVYYQSSGNDGILNCQGGAATPNPKGYTATRFVNSFSIQKNTDGTSQLQCQVTTIIDTNGVPSRSSNAAVLASNVKSMSILYGIDSQGTGTTDTYYTAAQVTSNNKWSSVRVVQITLNFLQPNVLNPSTTNSGFATTSQVSPWVQVINIMSKS